MANKRIQVEQFVQLYLKAVDEGLNREEFSKRTGLRSEYVYQRVRELKARGVELPVLKSGGRLTLAERARAAVESHGKSRVTAKVTPKQDVAVEEPDPLADILG